MSQVPGLKGLKDLLHPFTPRLYLSLASLRPLHRRFWVDKVLFQLRSPPQGQASECSFISIAGSFHFETVVIRLFFITGVRFCRSDRSAILLSRQKSLADECGSSQGPDYSLFPSLKLLHLSET